MSSPGAVPFTCCPQGEMRPLADRTASAVSGPGWFTDSGGVKAVRARALCAPASRLGHDAETACARGGADGRREERLRRNGRDPSHVQDVPRPPLPLPAVRGAGAPVPRECSGRAGPMCAPRGPTPDRSHRWPRPALAPWASPLVGGSGVRRAPRAPGSPAPAAGVCGWHVLSWAPSLVLFVVKIMFSPFLCSSVVY